MLHIVSQLWQQASPGSTCAQLSAGGEKNHYHKNGKKNLFLQIFNVQFLDYFILANCITNKNELRVLLEILLVAFTASLAQPWLVIIKNETLKIIFEAYQRIKLIELSE